MAFYPPSGDVSALELEMQFDTSNPSYYYELTFDVDDNPDNKSIYTDSGKGTKLYNIDYDFSVADEITKTITRISDGAVLTQVTDTSGTIVKTVTKT